MYELIQVASNTYYIEAPAKIGLYRLKGNKVCLIDSGNGKDAAKKILRHLREKDWSLSLILNTHSHADHIGGNAFLQEKTGCKIYTCAVEQSFIAYPFLEPALLYGGCPPQELRNKFLMAAASSAQTLTQSVLPDGFSYQRLDGHSMAMMAVKTPDKVWFIGDALLSQTILNKYLVHYLYDVKAYMQSLEILQSLEGQLFIPAHGEPLAQLSVLSDVNHRQVEKVIERIYEICQVPTSLDDIVKQIFDLTGRDLDFTQYALTSSTLRGYLSYLQGEEKVQAVIEANKILWKSL